MEQKEQCWVTFTSANCDLVALANALPHLDGTVTVTLRAAHGQILSVGDPALSRGSVDRRARLAVAMSHELPRRYVSFNGDMAGNTQPQFHFCINQLPEAIGMLPVEVEIARSRGESQPLTILDPAAGYPAAAIVAEGDTPTVTRCLTDVIEAWLRPPSRTANVILKSSGDTCLAIFWPRVSAWRRTPGLRSGEVAFMELSGLFLLSD